MIDCYQFLPFGWLCKTEAATLIKSYVIFKWLGLSYLILGGRGYLRRNTTGHMILFFKA